MIKLIKKQKKCVSWVNSLNPWPRSWDEDIPTKIKFNAEGPMIQIMTPRLPLKKMKKMI
jgi:hypothetical protein